MTSGETIDYSKFRSSLQRLEEQHANYQRGNPTHSDLDREGVAESVIRRFKTCYDCLWKVLKRHLIDTLGVADPPNSPKPIFRLAYESHVLPSPLPQWLLYAETRIGTSHDYDGEKAQACVELVPAFIDDAVRLYQTLSGAPWE